VTSGYSIRRELTASVFESDSISSPLQTLVRQFLSNEKNLNSVIDRLFVIIETDTRIQHLFMNGDITEDEARLERIKFGKKSFIKNLLLSTSSSSAVSMCQDLRGVHEALMIDDYIFDVFLSDLERAFHSLWYDESLINVIVFRLDQLCRAHLISGTNKSSKTAVEKSMSYDGKTLHEKLGGEAGIDAISTNLFKTVAEDPRLKFYFVGISRPNPMVKNFTAAFTALSGGPGDTLYNAETLRRVHFSFGLTDFRFDVFIEHVKVAMVSLGRYDKKTIDVALDSLSQFRNQITAGGLLKFETARHRQQQKLDTLFNRIGGDAAMNAFMDKFFDLIALDPRIKMFFLGSKFTALKISQGKFIANLIGSPQEYTGPDLIKVHSMVSTRAISDFHLDSYIDDASKALAFLGVAQSAINEVCSIFESVRHLVVINKKRFDPLKALQNEQKQKILFEEISGKGGVNKLSELTIDKVESWTAMFEF
jgi:hemoglobin